MSKGRPLITELSEEWDEFNDKVAAARRQSVMTMPRKTVSSQLVTGLFPSAAARMEDGARLAGPVTTCDDTGLSADRER
jgi:hypothetical protein